MGRQEDREAHLQNCEFRITSAIPALSLVPQDFGANCGLSAIVFML